LQPPPSSSLSRRFVVEIVAASNVGRSLHTVQKSLVGFLTCVFLVFFFTHEIFVNFHHKNIKFFEILFFSILHLEKIKINIFFGNKYQFLKVFFLLKKISLGMPGQTAQPGRKAKKIKEERETMVGLLF
jgi:hypothetical protein